MTSEFAVMHHRRPDEPHRGPYATSGEAEDWVNEAIEDGFSEGVFFVAEREVSEWRRS